MSDLLSDIGISWERKPDELAIAGDAVVVVGVESKGGPVVFRTNSVAATKKEVDSEMWAQNKERQIHLFLHSLEK